MSPVAGTTGCMLWTYDSVYLRLSSLPSPTHTPHQACVLKYTQTTLCTTGAPRNILPPDLTVFCLPGLSAWLGVTAHPLGHLAALHLPTPVTPRRAVFRFSLSCELQTALLNYYPWTALLQACDS